MAAITCAALVGCSGPLSTIDPAGPHAASVATLWWVMLGGAAVLAAFVFAILALAFRRKHRADAPGDRVWIVWLGLAMPVAVLSALLVYALSLGASQLPVPASDAVRIGVEARQYGWAFRTPDGRVSEGVLDIPAGRPVDLAITATDVIHSLWIPRLAGKMDAIPGHTNMLRVIASEPGEYRGECAEYCGPGHKGHGFRVVAHAPEAWAALVGEGR